MIERDVVVTTKYGNMPSFAACPDGPGPFPGIIVYMDAPGIREELRNIARRIAKNGYFCLLPDMYYRIGTVRFDIPRRNDAMSVVIRGAMSHLSNAMVTDDTAGLIAYLDAQDKVKTGPVGCVGYCMSGCYVTTVAARFPHRIAAAAALYGIGIVTDREDSPHLLIDRIRGELYYGFAGVDPSVPEHVIPALKATLDKAGTKYEIETFHDAHHGFASPERPDYETHAAEASWAKIFALWERNLR
jgi:carboxymethylenebutenolidase